jgi:glycine dehydrogenase subunit 1
MVTAATIYMALLGFDGLRQVASRAQHATARLLAGLVAIDGVKRLFTGPHFHEVAVCLDRPVGPVLAALAEKDILGGYDLSASNPELGNALLVCATETKTDADIDLYVAALEEIFTAGNRRSA